MTISFIISNALSFMKESEVDHRWEEIEISSLSLNEIKGIVKGIL